MEGEISALHPMSLLKTEKDIATYLNVALGSDDPDLMEVAYNEAAKALQNKRGSSCERLERTDFASMCASDSETSSAAIEKMYRALELKRIE